MLISNVSAGYFPASVTGEVRFGLTAKKPVSHAELEAKRQKCVEAKANRALEDDYGTGTYVFGRIVAGAIKEAVEREEQASRQADQAGFSAGDLMTWRPRPVREFKVMYLLPMFGGEAHAMPVLQALDKLEEAGLIYALRPGENSWDEPNPNRKPLAQSEEYQRNQTRLYLKPLGRRLI